MRFSLNAKFRENLIAELINIAGAERQHYVAGHSEFGEFCAAPAGAPRYRTLR